ncbi:hypothetical protein A9Q89_03690 [Gammaproteobacteria bacterium 53_120_T64]|nr:hypothetical protein A9Q89_03690 [Gammaproteobacteria bacterium 53_120_T64]
MNRLKVTTLLLLMLASSLAQAFNNDWSKAQVQQRLITEAQRQGVSPALIMAVARVESNFNPLALSSAGARGVMQIMPATASGELGVSPAQLYDPAVNIEAGVRFIRQLLHRYGREEIALSHYNGGSAVNSPFGLRVIPATRQYVSDVQRHKRHFADQPWLAAGFNSEVRRGVNSDRQPLSTVQLSTARNTMIKRLQRLQARYKQPPSNEPRQQQPSSFDSKGNIRNYSNLWQAW